jgi:tetratricopeptide (TPR) repeat protein
MLRRLKTLFARHPRAVLFLLALVLVACTGGGLYAHALAEWQAAQSALEDEQAAEARRHLKVCLGVWPRSASVHLLAARAARLGGEFAEAEAQLNQCLKLRKDATADAELEFLLLRVQMGEADAVAPTLWQCVEQHHPQTPLILETLAQAYIHRVQYGPALTCLERCIQEAPERGRAHHWRGYVCERLGDRPEALRDYQRAVELEPDYIPARMHLGELYLQLSLPEEALPHLEYLQARLPGRADVRARLGHCRHLQGEEKEARRLLELSVLERPDDLSLLILLGQLDNQEEHFARAEHWLRHALEIDPTDPEAQHQLARSLQGLNRPEEAEAVEEQRRRGMARLKRFNELLREATRRRLTNPDDLSEIGRTFLEVHQERIGLDWLHQALEQDSSHQATHRALAEYFDKKGDKAQAEIHRRRLQEGGPAKDSPGKARKPEGGAGH